MISQTPTILTYLDNTSNNPCLQKAEIKTQYLNESALLIDALKVKVEVNKEIVSLRSCIRTCYKLYRRV